MRQPNGTVPPKEQRHLTPSKKVCEDPFEGDAGKGSVMVRRNLLGEDGIKKNEGRHIS